MILRRITEHVKAQNWFAVGLDFVIVVIGVFIGIQVSNWNEARSSSRQEGVLIAQLADDLRSMRHSFVFSDAISQKTHDGWVAMFRALEVLPADRGGPGARSICARPLSTHQSGECSKDRL